LVALFPPRPVSSTRAAERLRELVAAVLCAALLAAYVRTFVAQPFRIPSESMTPALLSGDQLLVNRFVYGPARFAWERRWLPLRDPARGDVAVFRYPRDPHIPYVKRIVALPGEVVRLRGRELRVDDAPVDESGYVQHADATSYPPSTLLDPFYRHRDNFGPERVPAASYFVLGDNRDLSADSRFWGYVPRHYFVGCAFAVYWSWAAPTSDEHVGAPRWHRIARLSR
jgi:signal peptidase I